MHGHTYRQLHASRYSPRIDHAALMRAAYRSCARVARHTRASVMGTFGRPITGASPHEWDEATRAPGIRRVRIAEHRPQRLLVLRAALDDAARARGERRPGE